MTQLHFSNVHSEFGNSMGIISRKFQYLAAILQLEKTISLSDNWSVGNSTTDILSTLFQCLNINSISWTQVPWKKANFNFWDTKEDMYLSISCIKKRKRATLSHHNFFFFIILMCIYAGPFLIIPSAPALSFLLGCTSGNRLDERRQISST